jgi:5'-nucleotidase
MEAREFSIPSIAISSAAFIQPSSEGKSQPNFLTAARIALDIIERLPELRIDSQITLNVNVPNLNYEEINKINLTYPGTWGKRNPPNKETSNSGEDQFWITHRNKIPENEENSDIATLSRGEVSISPIGPRFLINDYDQSLKEWINSFN